MIKMKCVVLLVIFFLCITQLNAQAVQKKSLSVFELTNYGLEVSEVKTLTEILATAFFDTNLFEVIEKSQREKKIQELKLSMQNDETVQLENAKILTIQFIITGSIGKIGDNIILNLKAIDVESGDIVSSTNDTFASMKIILTQLNQIAARITLDITGIDVSRELGETSYYQPSFLEKLSFVPALYTGILPINQTAYEAGNNNNESAFEDLEVYTACLFGATIGAGYRITDFLSITLEGGFLMQKADFIQEMTGSTVYPFPAVPVAARIIFGNRNTGFCFGGGVDWLIPLMEMDYIFIVTLFPTFAVYYKDFFVTFSYYPSSEFNAGIVKVGYEIY